MQKRFIILSFLAVLGIALLAVGWRGGINGIKDTQAPINPGLAENSTAIEVKPDSSPPGNAMKVQKEEAEDTSVEQSVADGSDYFVEYRLDRERSRGHQIQLLREIINNANSDTDNRKQAQEQMYVISNNLQKELEVESLIRAKGYRDAVVFLEGKTVTAVIQSNALTQEDAIKITDMVSRSTGIGQQNIVLIPKS